MKMRYLAAIAAVGLVAACTVDTNGNVAVFGQVWTGTAAADVEVNAALGAVAYLKAFEGQVPQALDAIKAAGNALSAGTISAADALTSSASPAVQTKQAAISAVMATAPSLATLITTKQSGSGSAITVATDLAALLLSETNYLLPSVAGANAGTITATQLKIDEDALRAAAAAL